MYELPQEERLKILEELTREAQQEGMGYTKVFDWESDRASFETISQMPSLSLDECEIDESMPELRERDGFELKYFISWEVAIWFNAETKHVIVEYLDKWDFDDDGGYGWWVVNEYDAE